MVHPFKFPLLAAGFLLSVSAEHSPAQTRMSMSISGVFHRETGFGGHPDISIGDSYLFTLDFDNSRVFEGPQLTVYSLLSATFSVNGSSHAFVMPEFLSVQADMPGRPPNWPPQPATILLGGNDPIEANSVVLARTPLAAAVPTAIGEWAEFQEIPLFNSMDLASAEFHVNAGGLPGTDSVVGSVTHFSITVVPEPGSVTLCGIAGLGMMRRRRR